MVEAVRTTCVHKWDIAPPAGPTSPGTCRDCGEVRDFLNSCDELLKVAAHPSVAHKQQSMHREEVPVSKVNVFQRHQEIEEQWPEIKRTIEETGGLNRAAKQLGISYDGVAKACGRHGFDLAQYTGLKGRRFAPVRETDGEAFRAKAPTGRQDNIGEALIGVGLVMIGAWLKSKEG
jgi:hypothetical protein